MSRRTQKVEELLREELSQLIQEKLADKIGLATITRVLVSPDFKLAKIYIALMDPSHAEHALKQLEMSRKNFQNALGRKLSLRYTPKIQFQVDDGMNEIDRVEELLEKIKDGN